MRWPVAVAALRHSAKAPHVRIDYALLGSQRCFAFVAENTLDIFKISSAEDRVAATILSRERAMIVDVYRDLFEAIPFQANF
jgi:hypothetical protein